MHQSFCSWKLVLGDEVIDLSEVFNIFTVCGFEHPACLIFLPLDFKFKVLCLLRITGYKPAGSFKSFFENRL